MWLKMENTPAQVNNWISVLPASHHLLTTGTSTKPFQLGRDHPKWPVPRHPVLVQPLPAMNRIHPPLSVHFLRHGLQSAPWQQPQRPCSAAGGKPAQEGWAEKGATVPWRATAKDMEEGRITTRIRSQLSIGRLSSLLSNYAAGSEAFELLSSDLTWVQNQKVLSVPHQTRVHLSVWINIISEQIPWPISPQYNPVV